MTVKYHLNGFGEARVCVAENSCRFGDADNHYGSAAEAYKSYEAEMEAEYFKTLVKKSSEDEVLELGEEFWDSSNYKAHFSNTESYHKDYITVSDGGFEFSSTVTDYGITFKEPDVDGVYLEEVEEDDNAMFFRFDLLYDVFDEVSGRSSIPGYSMDVDFHSLQYKVSEKIVDSYAEEKNPFAHTKYRYNDEEFHYSIPSVLVIENEVYIVDGNHRFIAAKKKGMKAFAAVVIEYNREHDTICPISPDEFNRRFAKS